MKTKYIFVLAILCIVTNTFSQTSLNEYKYVIVPKQFNFQKSPNKYQLNSLAYFLFNKYGFNAIMIDEQYPSDLASQSCLSLKAEVENLKGFLSTKLRVVLKNCRNEIIFTSKVGISREKEFKKSYKTALRDAFKSLESANYNYKPKEKTEIAFGEQKQKINVVKEQENEKLKEEIKAKKAIKKNIAKVEVEQNIKKKEITDTKKKGEKLIIPKENSSKILYAQEIENGFQVVDATPKVVMILLKTPKQDIFIVKGRDAVVYKENDFWYFSETNEVTTTTKILNIRF